MVIILRDTGLAVVPVDLHEKCTKQFNIKALAALTAVPVSTLPRSGPHVLNAHPVEHLFSPIDRRLEQRHEIQFGPEATQPRQSHAKVGPLRGCFSFALH